MVFEASPGELYKGITALGETFEGEETKAVIEKENDFVIFCKKMNKQFPGIGKGAVFTEKHDDAVKFLGWRLTAQEFMAGIKGTFILGLIPFILVMLGLLFVGFNFDFGIGEEGIGLGMLDTIFGEIAFMVYIVAGAGFLAIIGAICYTIYLYPLNAAEDERNKALTYVPEMVGYLIMSMKLVPNLEKAIEFSAKHGKGKVADDFKRLIWDFQIGVYSSISEGLDLMAMRWGKYSSELKESLMKIRASVMEPSESKRYQILDKTMMEVLDSVKDKMGDYARSLNQPAVMLFYIGVLLPLLLVIILPVGSAFSALPFATTPFLIAIYVIGIPLFAYNFAKGIVKKRPPTYETPIIDDNYPTLPPKYGMKLGSGFIDVRLACFILLFVGVGISFVVSIEGLPPRDLFPLDEEGIPMIPFQLIPADKQLDEVFKDKGVNYFEKVGIDLYAIQLNEGFGGGIREGERYTQLIKEGNRPEAAEELTIKEKLDFVSDPSRDPTKYIFWAGTMITLALCASLFIHHRNVYKRQVQLQIVQMEDEFKESMYMIASRMGENKPVENALKQAKDYLPNLLISKRIFSKTVENIELMGLPLEGAIFDPVYGAMRGIPSKILSTAMRLLVDSVNLGVEVASRTLMSLSLQMENMDKVNKSLKEMVSDVTTTMQTMAVFIAPMVLGITTALQKVVMMTLASVVASPEMGADSPAELGNIGTANLNLFKVNVAVFKSFATPLEYMIIIGIYVALIVVILTFFTTKIKEDNDLLFKLNLAKYLPIAVTVYVVTTIAANILISSLMSTG